VEILLLLIHDLCTRWGEWSVSRPGCALSRGKNPRYQSDRRLGGLQSRSGHRGSCLFRGSNLDRPVVQSVARYCTHWATPSPRFSVSGLISMAEIRMHPSECLLVRRVIVLDLTSLIKLNSYSWCQTLMSLTYRVFSYQITTCHHTGWYSVTVNIWGPRKTTSTGSALLLSVYEYVFGLIQYCE
jgi:hypothetical protein